MTSEGFGQLFARAGCRGWLCAIGIDDEGEVSAGGGEPVAAASVFKVAVALEVFTQAATGRLDPGKRIRVSPARRTPGPTGLSVFADEAELSVRDLAVTMLTVSDNAATDILVGLVGLDAIHSTLASLGLQRTVIPGPLQNELDSIGQDAGFAGWADLEQASATFSVPEEQRVRESIQRARALDPRQAIRTTARETAALLRLIWRDEAGPAEACAQVRQMMARQVTRQRLALGFPRAGVQVAAKSGSLLGVIRRMSPRVSPGSHPARSRPASPTRSAGTGPAAGATSGTNSTAPDGSPTTSNCANSSSSTAINSPETSTSWT